MVDCDCSEPSCCSDERSSESPNRENVQSVFVGDADDKEEVCEGKYQLVFTSLESLLMDPTWRNMLLSPIYQENLVALVINEAHCVNKW